MYDHQEVREVRDPIYGFVRLSRNEWEIINTPAFQRLRDIRQLAMGHLVYPGANHTRFEHSIGCVHLSTAIFDYLYEIGKDILSAEHRIDDRSFHRIRHILRLGSLLHDIGHPPFSHSGEDLLPRILDGQGKPIIENGREKKVSHEDMTIRLIRETEVGEKISELYGSEGITPEDVIAVAVGSKHAQAIRPQSHHLLLNQILTGDLGSDRIDYLLRDAYHSGQKSGEFDHRRLISTLILVSKPESEGEGYELGFDEGGWLVAEQMIVARYLMYLSLYFHKTKRIYEKHLEDFMAAWLADKGGHLPEDLKAYVALSDSNVLAELSHAIGDPDSPGHEYAMRFQARSHMRLSKEIILADNYRSVSGRREPDRDRFDKLRNEVSVRFGSRVRCDAPDHSATKIFGTHKILVRLDGKPRYLDDISEIVRGMSSKIWRGRVYTDQGILKEVTAACDEWLTRNPLVMVPHKGGES
jgi:uncharacterized protein